MRVCVSMRVSMFVYTDICMCLCVCLLLYHCTKISRTSTLKYVNHLPRRYATNAKECAGPTEHTTATRIYI